MHRRFPTKLPNYYWRLGFLFVLSHLISNSSWSQEKFSIYLDVGGASEFGSLNIEKRISDNPGSGLGVRGGVGVVGTEIVEPPRTRIKLNPSIPIGVNYIFGNGKRANNLEVGFQATYIFEMTVPEEWDPQYVYKSNIKNKILPSFFLGYRFRPFKKRGIIRIGYNPVILDGKIFSWGVLSVGWAILKKEAITPKEIH
ncbi:MAG: hypothetical protein ABIR30_11815 [Chitinophagaceae bacterium]